MSDNTMTRIGLAILVVVFLVIAFAMFQRISDNATPEEICIASGGESFENGNVCLFPAVTLERKK